MKNREKFPAWLGAGMRRHGVELWGAADLRGLPAPRSESGRRYPYAVAFAVPMNPQVMASIRTGPNRAYAAAYARANDRIDALAHALAAEIAARGHCARPLAASQRTDPVGIRGDFPHKTAATRAGIGWVGRHCQLITRPYGPWVRLGTVFTDLALACGSATERSFCGRCTRCVDACPAGALKGRDWFPGRPREEILDAAACDAWKREHFFQYHGGHNCGICSAVCPYGLKVLERIAAIRKEHSL